MTLVRINLIVAFFLLVSQAVAQNAQLIDAAKKEGGKVVIYGSLEAPIVDAVTQAFKRKPV
jgi:hypothetical protein